MRSDPPTPKNREVLIESIRSRQPVLAMSAVHRQVESVLDRHHALGPLARFVNDAEITEIMVNGPGPIWVERAGRLCQTDHLIGSYEIELTIERMLAPLGLRVDRTSPIVDARLADGSRVNIVVPPLAIDGPAISIRKFAAEPIDLSAFGPPAMTGILAELMADRASILVVGQTSSGKTTLINALSALIDPDDRVVTIEDTAELRLAVPNVVRLEARTANSEGVGEVTLRHLVLTALRMRPDRVVVGEVRGAEAFDLLLALTSGHRGSITSCHGADARSGLRRLVTLASLAGVPVDPVRLRQLAGDGIDVVVTTNRVGPDRLVSAIDELIDGQLVARWPDPPC